jgi:hypothetical protein
MLVRIGGTTTTWPHDGQLSRFPDCVELTTSFFLQSQTMEIRCGLSGRPDFADMTLPAGESFLGIFISSPLF